ncbi:sensor histidine kinase [Massilia forsythiae]|nr:histidine kinase [Massilia forsythiae]
MMHGVFASWRAARLYLLAWLMLGVLLAAMLAAGGAGFGASLAFALPLALVYAYATGFSAYYVCRAWPLGQRHPLAVCAGVGLPALCAAALWCALGAAWHGVLEALAPQARAVALGAPLLASMFGLGVILYGLSAAVNYLMLETEQVRRLETHTLEMRLAAQDAELRLLRAQIDPHFLFNSLNSISALTSLDPPGARAMTLRLADFFRHSLGLQAGRMVTLDAELALVRHFLAIEQVRFGARLHVEEAVDADALRCLLPPLLLQPLVENAVKHGIGRMLGPGLVRIAARRAGSILRIRIENDVDADGVDAGAGLGLGLDNVRRRLAAAYGHEAAAHRSNQDGLFCVELALPAREQPGET